jgi:hypothetical protein
LLVKIESAARTDGNGRGRGRTATGDADGAATGDKDGRPERAATGGEDGPRRAARTGRDRQGARGRARRRESRRAQGRVRLRASGGAAKKTDQGFNSQSPALIPCNKPEDFSLIHPTRGDGYIETSWVIWALNIDGPALIYLTIFIIFRS